MEQTEATRGAAVEAAPPALLQSPSNPSTATTTKPPSQRLPLHKHTPLAGENPPENNAMEICPSEKRSSRTFCRAVQNSAVIEQSNAKIAADAEAGE